MLDTIKSFLASRGIDLCAALPLSACEILRPYLLEREGIADGTAVLFAVPYYSRAADAENRNLSAYTVARDYHRFFASLFDDLLPLLRTAFPAYRFAGFSDHSPIREVPAAARCGLGVVGKNHLLLTERYSSYVFLGEIVTDALLKTDFREEIPTCPDCGACRDACPTAFGGVCLSALTQKKGELSAEEERTIARYGSVFGCDLCEERCPYTLAAKAGESIYSEIPFFSSDTLPHLSSAALSAMSEEEFSSRAFSWRGRETVLRNLGIVEGSSRDEEKTKERSEKRASEAEN